MNYKLVHAFVRLASLGGIALVFVVVLAGRLSSAALENLIIYLFLYLPIAVVSTVVFESFWLGRTERETRAIAIDWLFVVAYLVVWGFEMVRILMTPVFW